MQELISPAGSEAFVVIASFLLLLICVFCGWRAAGKRGIWAGAVGPLVWVLWQAHKYVTRYDAQSGYFGLDSVAVLLGEVVFFIVLGVVLGRVWNGITKTYWDEQDKRDEKIVG